MDGLTLPCMRCAPTAPAQVTGDVIRCVGCGSERPFTRAPLVLVTGAPATGKSSVVPLIAERLQGTAVFDTDLFGPLSHPDWAAWASGWLLMVHALAQSGIAAVLCGYGIRRSAAETLAPRVLLGDIRVLNLHLAPDRLRARLQTRPDYDDARVERKVAGSQQLYDEADHNVDVTDLEREQIASAVLAWLQQLEE